MTPELKATLATLPDRPGVYLMKDARGVVLYVGKAQSLRSRVRSYWQKQAPTARGGYHQIREAIDRVADLEVTEVDSVSEALLLEANLIKRFKPRFNVRLKDDKSYPYIKVTLGDDFPRIERTRKLPNDGSRYFGPYASASSVDEAMNLVRRLFPFRTCTIDIREGERALPRPCLLYHIKRCQGPCIEAISRAAYRRDIAQVELFLEGNADTLLEGLRHEMHVASEGEQYEKAAAVRDKIRSIERTMESQKMAAFARTELDLVAMARRDDQAAVQLFVVRNGKMLGRDVFFLESPHEVPDDEVLGAFLLQYYARATSVPREILVPRSVTETAELEAFLAARRGSVVRLRTPQRGEKRELMDLAARNAAEALAREAARWLADEGRTLGALAELAAALGLPGPPLRIECYDISNFQGAQSVGSMVVFEEGRPRTGEYRRFQIRSGPGSQRLRQPPGGPAPAVPPRQGGRGGDRGGAPLGDAGPRHRRRRPRPGQRREGGPRRAGPRRPAARRAGQGARGADPARSRGAGRAAGDVAGPVPRPAAPRRGPPLRDHVPPQPARTGGRPGARSTTCRASARSASASCSRSSGPPSACARRRSSRSRPCRGSGGPSRSGSRRTWRPDRARAVRRDGPPPGRPARIGLPLYHPAPMRRAGPILIVVVGLLAFVAAFFPVPLPSTGDERGRGRSRPSWGSTSAAACGSSTRCSRPRARRRAATTSRSCGRSSSTASTSPASRSPRSSSRAPTGSSSRCPA